MAYPDISPHFDPVLNNLGNGNYRPLFGGVTTELDRLMPQFGAAFGGKAPVPQFGGLSNDLAGMVSSPTPQFSGVMGVMPTTPTFGGTMPSFGGVDSSMFNLPGMSGMNNTFDATLEAVRNSLYPPAPLPGAPGAPAGSGVIADLGNHPLNQYDSYFLAAGQSEGIDPLLLKAIAYEESGWNDPVSTAGAVGIMQLMPNWETELGYPVDRTNPQQNIMAGAKVLKQKFNEGNGTWDDAVRRYHGYGSDGNTTDQQYLDAVMSYYHQLQQAKPIGGSAPGGAVSGSPTIQAMLQYVGRPYVWGGNQPSGWDCSGMTWWFDQTYLGGHLPQGSHYQYQYGLNAGMIFQNSSQLRPGDLVFYDTGWMGGGGSEMNRAGHVGIYIGGGKVLNALNPDAGTVISDFQTFPGTFLGAMHWFG